MVTELMPAETAPVALDEIKAFLRLTGSDEDALLDGFVRVATSLAEAFTNQRLIARDVSERLVASAAWQRLNGVPVVAITGIADASGPLAGSAFETDIDLDGRGWVRITNPATLGAVVAAAIGTEPAIDGWDLRIAPRPQARVTVAYRVGMAADWNGVPEPLRQGITRLVAHLYTHRDAADAGGPPAAVAALWRPWRRMRIH